MCQTCRRFARICDIVRCATPCCRDTPFSEAIWESRARNDSASTANLPSFTASTALYLGGLEPRTVLRAADLSRHVPALECSPSFSKSNRLTLGLSPLPCQARTPPRPPQCLPGICGYSALLPGVLQSRNIPSAANYSQHRLLSLFPWQGPGPNACMGLSLSLSPSLCRPAHDLCRNASGPVSCSSIE